MRTVIRESQVLSLFDGDGNSSTRATRDGGSYDESHVSIVGGIQPSVLKDLIKGDDRTGKWARFLWVQYPPGIIIPPDDDPTEGQLRRPMTPASNANFKMSDETSPLWRV